MKVNKKLLLILAVLLSAAMAKAQQEVVVLGLHYEDGLITVKDKTVQLGYYPDRNVQPELGHRLEVVSFDGEKLYSFRFKLPIDVFTDYSEGDELKGGLIRLNETDFALVIPYFEDAKEVRFYNERNYPVSTVTLAEEQMAPKEAVLFGYAVIGLIIAGLLVSLRIRKRR